MAKKRFSRFIVASGIVCVTAAAVAYAQQPSAPAPTYIPQTQFDSGQDIVPVFEGWIKNPDGTFDFVFGYLNRNFKEELAIAAGPNNSVDPGGPDRGQPTYFLSRRQSRLFRVRVPKDWGSKVLTWAITANGRTEKAYADLRAVEEINEEIMQTGGNSVPFEPGNANPNTAPVISLSAAVSATVSTPLRLVANVTDDGLPKPRTPPAQAAPANAPAPGTPRGQANAGGQANGLGGGRGRGGLSVRWLEYGGPGRITFNPSGATPVTNGTAETTMSVTLPGTYRVVATATDGQLSSRAAATITVK